MRPSLSGRPTACPFQHGDLGLIAPVRLGTDPHSVYSFELTLQIGKEKIGQDVSSDIELECTSCAGVICVNCDL